MVISRVYKRLTPAVSNQDIAPTETGEDLKELLCDLVRKSWNATRFMEGGTRLDRQHDLRTLWADKQLVDFDIKTGSTANFT